MWPLSAILMGRSNARRSSHCAAQTQLLDTVLKLTQAGIAALIRASKKNVKFEVGPMRGEVAGRGHAETDLDRVMNIPP